MGDAIPKLAIVCAVCHTIIECLREASDHWPQQAVPSRCLRPVHTPSTFQVVAQSAPNRPSPEKGDVLDSTAEVEAIVKVGLEGGHHNDACDHNIGVGSSRKAGDDPCPQNRVDNVLLYEFGHPLGHISISCCVSVTVMVDHFSLDVHDQLGDQSRENSPLTHIASWTCPPPFRHCHQGTQRYLAVIFILLSKD